MHSIAEPDKRAHRTIFTDFEFVIVRHSNGLPIGMIHRCGVSLAHLVDVLAREGRLRVARAFRVARSRARRKPSCHLRLQRSATAMALLMLIPEAGLAYSSQVLSFKLGAKDRLDVPMSQGYEP